MDAVESAGEEIERTLKAAGDRTEIRIAKYRLFLFAVMLLAITGISIRSALTGEGYTLVAVAFGAALVAYSAILWVAARRFGAAEGLVYAVVFLDLLIAASPPFVFWWIEGGLPKRLIISDADELRTWGMMMASPLLAMTLILNILRFNRRSSLLGAVVAPVLLLVVIRGTGAMEATGVDEATVVMQVVLLALVGLLGLPAATAARESLLTFARLQLLERYLPPAVVSRVKSEDVDRVLALGGRLETVTIVATDLRGFTALSESMPPARVIEELNAYHGAILAEVDRHGGMLDKFIGDGSLIVFGLSLDGAAAPADAGAAAAVGCARAMLGALERHNAERTARGRPPLVMGIGVHTGPVIAGNLGAGRRREFTVIGDTVNTASRLEGLTKEAGTPILVSAETRGRMPGESAGALTALPPMTIRGKSEAVSLYAAGR